MTREQLIKAIYDNDDAWSCPEYSCDMPEKEGNTGKCCWDCAEKQLKAYEGEIRADVIEKVLEELEEEREDILYGNEYESEIINYCLDNFDRAIEIVERQLKEQNIK